MFVGDEPAYELSFWCGTCAFIFRRLAGANAGGSLDELAQRLTVGLTDLDGVVVDRFGSLLAAGEYRPLLLEVMPRLTAPGATGDYFAEEQVSTWGLTPFWGLPEYPGTPYYRGRKWRVDKSAHLYEFVVPMVPPSWNERDRVSHYVERLQRDSLPTAVAVSILDVCEPAVTAPGRDRYAHWGLTHFLLDGHHKFEAAASLGVPLRMLSLLSTEGSLALPDQVAQVPDLLRSTPRARVST
jgi:hypothetical protein